jgi:ElaB/YqjD/DUF883 family membrane-anchored ribosome-binding protein
MSLPDAKASRIAQQVDEFRRETVESLHAAASSIRKGSKAIEDLAESTANKLGGAGAYVEKHDLKRTIGESRQLIRQYPVELVVLAAGAGFVTGFAIRRLTHACEKSEPCAPGQLTVARARHTEVREIT